MFFLIFLLNIPWTGYGMIDMTPDPAVYVRGGYSFSWINPAFLYKRERVTFVGGLYPQLISHVKEGKKKFIFNTGVPSVGINIPVKKFIITLGNYEMLNFNWNFTSDTLKYEDFLYRYIYKAKGGLYSFRTSLGYEISKGFYGGAGVSFLYGTLVEEWITEVIPYSDLGVDTMEYRNSGMEYVMGFIFFSQKFALSLIGEWIPSVNLDGYIRSGHVEEHSSVEFKDMYGIHSGIVMFTGKPYSFSLDMSYLAGDKYLEFFKSEFHIIKSDFRISQSLGGGFLRRSYEDFFSISYGFSLLLSEKYIIWAGSGFMFSKDTNVFNLKAGFYFHELWKLRERGWY